MSVFEQGSDGAESDSDQEHKFVQLLEEADQKGQMKAMSKEIRTLRRDLNALVRAIEILAARY